MPLSSAVIGIAIAVIITALIVWNVAISYRKKVVESKIGSAEEKAREIIDEAMKTAETKKREGLLEVKEEALRNKNELEKESKERRAELQKYEKRVLAKEEAVDRKADSLEKPYFCISIERLFVEPYSTNSYQSFGAGFPLISL